MNQKPLSKPSGTNPSVRRRATVSDVVDDPLSGRFARPTFALTRRPLPAWAISASIHLVAFMMLAYLLRIATPSGGGGTEPDRTVGVALVQESGDEREVMTTEQAQQQQQQPSTNAAATSTSPTLPTEAELAIDLSGALPAMDGSLADGSDFGDLTGPPADRSGGGRDGLSKSVRTGVFGTSGTGTTFVYVFDRSGSMAGFGGRPLAAAKRELIASLQDLTETNQFQIIFYNEDPHVFRPRGGLAQLVWADDEGKDLASRFIAGIQAAGGTRHLEPLKMALNLRPDVVFFLTDADEPQLSRDELDQINRWNQSSSINAIQFGFGPQNRQDNFLMKLAKENGGQHVYVDVSLLKRRERGAITE